MMMASTSTLTSCSTVRAALLRRRALTRTRITTAIAIAKSQRQRNVYSWSRIPLSIEGAKGGRGGGRPSDAAIISTSFGCSQEINELTVHHERIAGLSSSTRATTTTLTTLSQQVLQQRAKQVQQQQQQGIHGASDEGSSSSQPNSSTPPSGYRLSDMTREDLEKIPNSSIYLLQDLVRQLEEDEWPSSLTSDDVSFTVRPLMSACLRLRQHAVAADLAERILFTCLARLPPAVADRYPENDNDNSNDRTTTTTKKGLTMFPYPHADMYTKVMLACGNLRTPAAAERAHRIFRLQVAEYRTEVQYLMSRSNNNSSSSNKNSSNNNNNQSSSSSNNSNRIDGLPVVHAPAPRTETFKTLLRAHAVSYNNAHLEAIDSDISPHSAFQAHDILNTMEALSGFSSSSSLSSSSSSLPTSPSSKFPDFTVRRSGMDDVLGGKSNGNSNRGEMNLLHLAKPPDLMCYNSVLTAYSKCSQENHPQVLKRALSLWERMKSLQDVPYLKNHRYKDKYKEYQLDWFSYHAMLRILHNHVQVLSQQRQSISSSKQPTSNNGYKNDGSDDAGFLLIDHDALLQEIEDIVMTLTQTISIPPAVPRQYRVLNRQYDGEEKYNNNTPSNNPLQHQHPITGAYQVLIQALVLPRPRKNAANHYHRHHSAKIDNSAAAAAAAAELLELELEQIQQAHDIILALAGQQQQHLDSGSLDAKVGPIHYGGIDGEDIVWPCQDVIFDVIHAWERFDFASKRATSGSSDDDDDGVSTTTATAVALVPKRIQELVQVAVNAPYKRLSEFHQAMDFWRTKSHWKHAAFVNHAILERLLREHPLNYSELGPLSPTSLTFAMVMWSWKNSQSDLAPHKVERLFDQLLLLYEQTYADQHVPNATHIHLLLESWIRHCPSGSRFDGKSGKQLLAAQHVTLLLQSFDTPSKIAWLNSHHFGVALKAWARQRLPKHDNGEKSEYPDQAQEAFALWNRLADANYVPPMIYCNFVLESCVNASTDAQRLHVSEDETDNDAQIKEQRQSRYDIAMHVYRRMKEHEVKNKDKGGDKQRLKRDSFSYILMLQVWKVTWPSPDHGVVDDPVQFVQQIMEDCCAEGLFTQTLCYEIVEFLLIFAPTGNDDRGAQKIMERFFGLTEASAVSVLEAAATNLVREPKSSKIIWEGKDKPQEILIQNLPRQWCRNTPLGKHLQSHKNHSITPQVR